MQYLGGKSRIAKWVAGVIANHWTPGMGYYEPFVGGGSVLVAVSKLLPEATLHAFDNHLDLILLWKAIQAGWEPPEEVSEDDYNILMTAEPSALRGFVGFGCSFGGKWFGGYARNSRLDNYANQARNGIIAKSKRIKHVEFTHLNYISHSIPSGSLVYCDPPYEGTTKYHCTFNHDQFWQWATQLSHTCSVLVSSYQAREGWSPVATLERHQELRTNGVGRKPVTEHIFKWEAKPTKIGAVTVDIPFAGATGSSWGTCDDPI